MAERCTRCFTRVAVIEAHVCPTIVVRVAPKAARSERAKPGPKPYVTHDEYLARKARNQRDYRQRNLEAERAKGNERARRLRERKRVSA